MKNRIEEIRKARDVNQEELAKALGVSRQTISSLENGRYNPSIELAYKLSKYFGMTIEEVFIFEEAERLQQKNLFVDFLDHRRGGAVCGRLLWED